MKKLVLNNHEKALIIAIRTKFKFGEVTVMVKDGRPVYIKRAWESDNLDVDLTED